MCEVEMATNHVLKTDPIVFQEIFDGHKNFEIRLNDRNFTVGDSLTLMETVYSGEEMSSGKPCEYTGREIDLQIDYILNGPQYGLADGWVIMSVSRLVDDCQMDAAGQVSSDVWHRDFSADEGLERQEKIFRPSS